MKKNILFGFAILTLVITSCKAPQVVEQSPPQVQQTEEKPPIEWLQKYFAAFNVKKIQDSVLFYNSSEISMNNKGGYNQSVTFEGGAINLVEETNKVKSKVSKLTAGKLVRVEYSSDRKINKMLISFDPNDRKYDLWFYLATDGTYILNGQPELRCKLMFYLNRTSIMNEAFDEARGWKF